MNHFLGRFHGDLDLLDPYIAPRFARDNLRAKKVSVTAKSPSKMVKKGPKYPFAHCVGILCILILPREI
jgi:hypothetical protein